MFGTNKNWTGAFRTAKFAEKNGVHMMINLNHFTLPQWAAAKGGWENDDLPALFAIYAEKVGKKFKPLGIRILDDLQ